MLSNLLLYSSNVNRCRELGKNKSKDGENSMFFDMPLNRTTCHCIGPAYADKTSDDTKDNQGPLGGKLFHILTIISSIRTFFKHPSRSYLNI